MTLANIAFAAEWVASFKTHVLRITVARSVWTVLRRPGLKFILFVNFYIGEEWVNCEFRKNTSLFMILLKWCRKLMGKCVTAHMGLSQCVLQSVRRVVCEQFFSWVLCPLFNLRTLDVSAFYPPYWQQKARGENNGFSVNLNIYWAICHKT